jgi:hypothetical protein
MTAPHFQATPGEVAVSQLGTLNKKSLALSAWNEKTAADLDNEARSATPCLSSEPLATNFHSNTGK